MAQKRRKRAVTRGDSSPPCTPGESTLCQVYEAAKAYVASGLSLIPIRADGTKMPAFELLPKEWDEDEGRQKAIWKCFKARLATHQELRSWFRDSSGDYGMAVLGGAISGGLEIIDCDNWDVAERWSKMVAQKAPKLFDRLVRVRSPRPGLHAYYRCSKFGGNQKLARIPDPAHANLKPKAIIEIKGEAGYCLAPPSPPTCHPTGRCYEFLDGKDFTTIPTISGCEREVLLTCARSLNCWDDPERSHYTPRQRRDATGPYDRPGDDFNARADWGEILTPHGWAWVRRAGEDADHWRRPGKSRGMSATTNYGGSALLFVFSANAPPFDERRAYNKFQAYTLLNHDGDFHDAARTLARRGYGQGRKKGRGRAPDPFARYAGYVTRSRYRSR